MVVICVYMIEDVLKIVIDLWVLVGIKFILSNVDYYIKE